MRESHQFKGDFSKLESESRKKVLPVDTILKAIRITPGSVLIDFGCGIGYFSIPATKYVGNDGKVIAIDISNEMIEELKKRAVGIKNIEIVRSDDITGYKSDIIILVTVLHEMKDPKTFLNKCLDALNPEGRVVIIDWQKKETQMGPPAAHRISKDEVVSMLGKDFIEHDIDGSLYFLEFRK